MVHDGEVAVWLSLPVHARSLVDGREVEESPVGLSSRATSGVAERPVSSLWVPTSWEPDRSVSWTVKLSSPKACCSSSTTPWLSFIWAVPIPRQISLGGRSRGGRSPLAGAFRSRMDGVSGLTTPCGPTTQLRGRFSLPT